MTAAGIALIALAAYFGAGLFFGLAFVSAGIQRVDHAAAGSGIGFRLLVLPGTAALWPLLLTRWIRAVRNT